VFSISFFLLGKAIYYFFRDAFEKNRGGAYDARYDNLLFYYSFMYSLIQDYYKTNQEKTFRKIPGYIHYDEEKK
jgi:hypothetical protein